MPFLLIRHKVEDFAKWRPAYDSHLPSRQQAGLAEKYLLRNMANPNEVVILFTVDDIDKARDFIGSSGLRQAMQNAGVLGQPDICFLR
jgi:hypothetical protein